jgi:hypothetical protein
MYAVCTVFVPTVRTTQALFDSTVVATAMMANR